MGGEGSSRENFQKPNHIFFLILTLSFRKPDFDDFFFGVFLILLIPDSGM